MLRGIALWFIAYWQRRCKQKIKNKLAEWKWTFIDCVQLIHRCMQRNVIAAVVRCRPHAALFARKHIHWCNKCMMIVYILLYFVPLFIRCGRSPPVCVSMVFIALRLQNRWNTEIAVSVFFLSGSNIYANPLRFACLDDVVNVWLYHILIEAHPSWCRRQFLFHIIFGMCNSHFVCATQEMHLVIPVFSVANEYGINWLDRRNGLSRAASDRDCNGCKWRKWEKIN